MCCLASLFSVASLSEEMAALSPIPSCQVWLIWQVSQMLSGAFPVPWAKMSGPGGQNCQRSAHSETLMGSRSCRFAWGHVLAAKDIGYISV